MDSIEISPQQALAQQQAGARLIDLRDLDERATGMAAGAQAIALARVLDARGCHFIHVSSGGLDGRQQIPVGPGYQLPLAQAIKAEVEMPVIAVGLITEPTHAEAVVATGQADAVGIARGILYNPRWPWHAAAALGVKVPVSPQYRRCEPLAQRGLFA